MNKLCSLFIFLGVLVSTSIMAVHAAQPRGPYLQSVTDHGIIVRWRSQEEGLGVVAYGVSPDRLDSLAYSRRGAGEEHDVALEDLKANTRYYYSIGLKGKRAVRDEYMFFQTAPVTGSRDPSRVWIIGDSGDVRSNNGMVKKVYQGYLADTGSEYTHVWLMLGDNAYGDGEDKEFQRHLFDVFPELLKQTALWPAYGNHDAHASDSATHKGPYFDIFNLPMQGEAGGEPSESEAYHSFNYGNIHFVNLDSSETAGRSPAVMKEWLEKDLQRTRKEGKTDWTIAFFHHPPYSKGSHDSDNERDVDGTNDTWGGVSEMKIMRETFLPILEKHDVDLVFSGHSHSYERSMLIKGHYGESDEFRKNPSKFIVSDHDNRYQKIVTTKDNKKTEAGSVYVVAGNAAKNNGWGSLDHPVMKRGMKVPGSVVLEVDGLKVTVRMITNTGELKDKFSLEKIAQK